MSCPKCNPQKSSDAQPESGAHFQEMRKNQLFRRRVTAVLERPSQQSIVLVGNPNVGKSTVFNALTGARQTVINAPGTTVEVMAGTWKALHVRLLDLPGTYSLIPNSPDEQVVRDTVTGAEGALTFETGVDLALVLVDATAVTRSLYILGQVAQAGVPVVVVVTLNDVMEREGHPVDVDKLQRLLGVPAVAVDARSNKGIDQLTAVVKDALVTKPHVDGIQQESDLVSATASHLEESGAPAGNQVASVDSGNGGFDIFDWVDTVSRHMDLHQDDPEPYMSRSDKIDRVLLHPLVGIPIFFALMWLMFKVAGEWVGPLQDFFEGIFTNTDEGAISLANILAGILGSWTDNWFGHLIIDGLCGGLGVVSSFLPLMFVVFLIISVLEDSGYMARAAFLGDRVMRMIGLDGRVILPLIMGFGCNLPSLAATRTLPNAKQRLVTTLIIPYTSCAARLTIYLMIARIFFPNHTGTVVFALYVLSLVMIVLGALVLKPFVNKEGAKAPLMLVLPAYQVPRVLVTLKQTWLRSWSFVKGAGQIIVAMTLVVWFMSAIPVGAGSSQYSFADPELPMEQSLYGRTAELLVPAFEPTGFGEWHMTGALMTGFVAKETVISSIVQSYNMDPAAGGDAEDGGDDLGQLPQLVNDSFQKSAGDAAPLAAFAFLVFVLTYTPCLATVAEQARQIGGKAAGIAVVVQLAAAWVLATGIFQIGRLFW